MTNMKQENPCEVCKTTQKSEAELEEHQVLNHLKCPKCQIEHNSLAALLCHQHFEHRDGNWLKECLHCDFISTPRLVQAHEFDQHSDNGEFDNDEEVLMETENEGETVESSNSEIDSSTLISNFLREVIAKVVVDASHENKPDEDPMTVEDEEKSAKTDLNSAIELILDEMITKVVVGASNGNEPDEDPMTVEDAKKTAATDLNTAIEIIIDEVITKVVAASNEPNGENDAQPAVGDGEKSSLDVVMEDVTPTELDTTVNPFENLKSAPEPLPASSPNDDSALQIGNSNVQNGHCDKSKDNSSIMPIVTELEKKESFDNVTLADTTPVPHDTKMSSESAVSDMPTSADTVTPKETTALPEPQPEEEPKDSNATKSDIDFTVENIINELISRVIAAKYWKPMHDKDEKMDTFELEAVKEQSEPKESESPNDISEAPEEPTVELGLGFAINVINEIISNVVFAKHQESIQDHPEPETISSAKSSPKKMANDQSTTPDEVGKTSLPISETESTSPPIFVAKKSLPLPRTATTAENDPKKIVTPNGPRSCEFCGFSANETSMFFHHRASKHFACPTCAKVYPSVSSVLEHQMSDHKDAEKYQLTICQCSYCKYVPDQKSEEKQPEIESPGSSKSPTSDKEDKVELKCELCDYSTYSTHYLVHHKCLKHFLCPHCPAFFQSLKHLLNHQNAMHATATKYVLKQCSKCDYISNRSGDILRHEAKCQQRLAPKVAEKKPEETKASKCDLCAYTTTTNDNLVYHKSFRHFMCPHCPTVFPSLKFLLEHQNKMHSQVSQFAIKKCRKCGYVSKPKDVAKHEAHVHNIKETTLDTTLTATDVSKLIAMKQISTPPIVAETPMTPSKSPENNTSLSEPNQDLIGKCNICKYESINEATLKVHKIVKHHICSKCDRQFPSHASLYHHQSEHENMSFVIKKCRFCDYFAYPVKAIQLHETSQHKGHNPPQVKIPKLTLKTPQNLMTVPKMQPHQNPFAAPRMQLQPSQIPVAVQAPQLSSQLPVPIQPRPTQIPAQPMRIENVLPGNQVTTRVFNVGKKSFRCEKCGHETINKGNLLQHKAWKHKMCPHCNHEFESLKEVHEHQQFMHPGSSYELKKCQFCYYLTFNAKVLGRHEAVCSFKGEQSQTPQAPQVQVPALGSSLQMSYKCIKCDFMTNDVDQYKYHKTLNHLECQHCYQIQDSIQALYLHQEKSHDFAMQYKVKQCEFCDFISTPNGIINHIKFQHPAKPEDLKTGPDGKYECGHCTNYVATNYLTLKQHLAFKHFICPLCNSSHEHVESLKEHALTHPGQKWVKKCTTVNGNFVATTELIVKPGPNEAEQRKSSDAPKLQLKSPQSLMAVPKLQLKSPQSLMAVPPENPVEVQIEQLPEIPADEFFEENVLKCDLCSYEASNSSRLIDHKAMSHLICPQCKIQAKTKIDLVEHLLATHKEDQMYKKCKFCDYVARVSAVNIHENIKHLKTNEIEEKLQKLNGKLESIETQQQVEDRRSSKSPKSLTCEFCSYEGATLTMMKYHRSFKHFACSECSEVCDSIKSLYEHQKVHPKIANSFRLVQCKNMCEMIRYPSQIQMHEKVCKAKMGSVQQVKIEIVEKAQMESYQPEEPKANPESKTEEIVPSSPVDKPEEIQTSGTSSPDLKCELCDYVGNRAMHLNYHRIFKHLACTQCDKVCDTLNELYEHQKVNHPDVIPTYCLLKCGHCGLVRLTHQMKMHVKSCRPKIVAIPKLEDGRKKRRPRNEVGNEEKKAKIDVEVEVNVDANISNVNKCEFCDFEAAEKSNLNFHRIRKHNACASCHLVFPSLEYLLDHQAKSHADDAEYLMKKCRFCQIVTKASLMEKHEEFVHKAELELEQKRKKLKCKVCDVSFTDSKTMSNHMIEVHVQKKKFEPIKIPIFKSAGTPEKRKLEAVKSSDNPEPPPKKTATEQQPIANDMPFQCGICKLKFKLLANLAKHHELFHTNATNETHQIPQIPQIRVKTEPQDCISDRSSRRQQVVVKEEPLDSMEVGQENIKIEPMSEMSAAKNLGKRSVQNFQKCEKCDLTFDDPAARIRHYSSNQFKKNQLFRCDLCPFTSCTRPSLKLHRQDSHRELTSLIFCQFCNIKCKNKKQYLDHCKMYHPEESQTNPTVLLNRV